MQFCFVLTVRPQRNQLVLCLRSTKSIFGFRCDQDEDRRCEEPYQEHLSNDREQQAGFMQCRSHLLGNANVVFCRSLPFDVEFRTKYPGVKLATYETCTPFLSGANTQLFQWIGSHKVGLF